MKYIKLFEERETELTEPTAKNPWNRRTAFNRDLTVELQGVCDQFSKFLPPSDIKQALQELVYKYEDIENESK